MHYFRLYGYLILFIAMLFAAPGFANQQTNTQPKAPALQQLEAAIAKLRKEKNIPSLAYALVDKNNIQLMKVDGLADIETGRTADSQTRYRIGSISKMFVSLAILKLVEEGRVSLNDEVAKIVPEVQFDNPWQQTHPIKIVHLLEHTTGWDELAFKEYAFNNVLVQSLAQSLAFNPDSRTSRWIPGSRSSYTNSGVAVAALIIEKISGETFENYVADNIFTAMAMSDATYHYTDAVKSFGATAYKFSNKHGNKPQPYKHIIMRPSGAINASIEDMAKFTQLFLNDGLGVLNPGTIARMERSESTNAGVLNMAYGLNNAPRQYKNWVYRGHDGSLNGHSALLQYLPEAGVGFVIMQNSHDMAALKQVSKLIKSFQTHQLPIKTISTEQPMTPAQLALDGYYYVINPRIDKSHFLNRLLAVYQVSADPEGLTITGLLPGSKPDRFYPVSHNRRAFKSSKHGLVAMTMSEDPLAGKVLHYGDKVLEPTHLLAVYGQFVIAILWLLSIVSSLLFFVIWGIRKLMGKIPSGDPTQIRLWPLFSSVAALCFVMSLMMGMQNPYVNLGSITTVSLSIMVSSIVFALCALMGIYQTFKVDRQLINKVAYWYSAGCAAIHLQIALYLTWFGVIGMQTWA